MKIMALKHKAAIYVPSTSDRNKLIDNEMEVRSIMSYLTDAFGGATAINGRGAYKSEAGVLIMEPVTICYAYGSGPSFEKEMEYILRLKIPALAEVMGQECMMVEIDNVAHLVYA